MKVSGTNRRRRLARRKSESYWRKGTDGGGSVLVARNKRPRRIRRRKPESMKDQEYRRLTEFARKLYRDQLAWVGELIGRHIRVSQDGCQYDIAWEGPHAAYKSSRAPSGGLERYEGDADTRPSRADRSESINGAVGGERTRRPKSGFCASVERRLPCDEEQALG